MDKSPFFGLFLVQGTNKDKKYTGKNVELGNEWTILRDLYRWRAWNQGRMNSARGRAFRLSLFGSYKLNQYVFERTWFCLEWIDHENRQSRKSVEFRGADEGFICALFHIFPQLFRKNFFEGFSQSFKLLRGRNFTKCVFVAMLYFIKLKSFLCKSFFWFLSNCFRILTNRSQCREMSRTGPLVTQSGITAKSYS